MLDDGTSLLGVHASPGSDDGPGIDSTSSDDEIVRLLGGVTSDWVVGGHTHDPTDRRVAGCRVLNPGSVGLPRAPGAASWMLITSEDGVSTTKHRTVGFDTAGAVEALYRRRHPNREFIELVLSRGSFLPSY